MTTFAVGRIHGLLSFEGVYSGGNGEDRIQRGVLSFEHTLRLTPPSSVGLIQP